MKELPRAALAMRPATLADHLFAPQRARLAAMVELHPAVLTEFDSVDARRALEDVEILITGWGCPRILSRQLDLMPHLRAVVFTGGSAGALVDPAEAARRGIALTNTGEGNAKGVAEYTFATIVLAGKRARDAERLYRERRAFIPREEELLDTGNFGRTVGLIGASRIGRRVAQLLAPTDILLISDEVYRRMRFDDRLRATS